jgi:hypothetical protein
MVFVSVSIFWLRLSSQSSIVLVLCMGVVMISFLDMIWSREVTSFGISS